MLNIHFDNSTDQGITLENTDSTNIFEVTTLRLTVFTNIAHRHLAKYRTSSCQQLYSKEPPVWLLSRDSKFSRCPVTRHHFLIKHWSMSSRKLNTGDGSACFQAHLFETPRQYKLSKLSTQPPSKHKNKVLHLFK